MTSEIYPDLNLPSLSRDFFGNLCVFTDKQLFDSLRLRIAFTTRVGGVSTVPFDSLNLSSYVGDDQDSVDKNIALIKEAFSVSCILRPKQVHGCEIIRVCDNSNMEQIYAACEAGADAIMLDAHDIAALLCFADCVPVILVSPTRRISVVHAGWKGVRSHIVESAFSSLVDLDKKQGIETASKINVYIGAHIKDCCFEASEEIKENFVSEFSANVIAKSGNVSLQNCIVEALLKLGADEDRICSLNKCTMCSPDEFFSFRYSDGICGRHGAFAHIGRR